MKLVNADIMLSIDMDEGTAVNLVVENASVFTDIVNDLYKQCQGDEGQFLLSNGDKELALGKVAEIIINPFAIDFNDKKIINKLYTELQVYSNDYDEEKASLNSILVNYLSKITDCSAYDLISYDLELDMAKLLKMYNVRIEFEDEGMLSRIIEYIRLMNKLLKKNLLILINIQSYLTKDEIASVYETAAGLKVQLLLIDNLLYERNANEKTIVIDKDKCIIEM